MKFRIDKYNDTYRQQVLEVWEASVRATHHFLNSDDIDFYKAIVSKIDFNQFTVYLSLSDKDEVLGFLGVADKKLEMMFLKPECIGKGIGRALTSLAIDELHVTEVDVNEGNVNAVIFYKSFGFEEYDRTELDSTGMPYPILKMRLRVE
ncbi:MAG: GNAT family N-acetyltransferase, partial [Cyclobacteriaceae bacterium]